MGHARHRFPRGATAGLQLGRPPRTKPTRGAQRVLRGTCPSPLRGGELTAPQAPGPLLCPNTKAWWLPREAAATLLPPSPFKLQVPSFPPQRKLHLYSRPHRTARRRAQYTGGGW